MVRTLAGGVGLVAAVPLTTVLAAASVSPRGPAPPARPAAPAPPDAPPSSPADDDADDARWAPVRLPGRLNRGRSPRRRPRVAPRSRPARTLPGVTPSRRTVLRGTAAAGGLLLARPALAPRGALADAIGPLETYATQRASRLDPALRLAYADMHNHTLFSDGDGDPAAAFGSMRDAGLDVAALTDHATVSKALGPVGSQCTGAPGGCGLAGIDENRWTATAGIADGGDTPDVFTAIRGFEWSSPTLGHVNVWFSADWIDPLTTNGNTTGNGVAQFLDEGFEGQLPSDLTGALDDLVRATPAGDASMAGFYAWLGRQPTGVPGAGADALADGGADGIFGFNHPGREPGRFGNFAFDADLVPRCVSLEMFNRGEDYLFEGTGSTARSPLCECLDAGWRPGLIGVTDEHGTDWGFPEGKGRGGLLVAELTRPGVRSALEARRFSATRETGLRLDATADGVPMGAELPHDSGDVAFALDLDQLPAPGVDAPSLRGRSLVVQVLQTGPVLPTVVATVPFTVTGSTDPGADTVHTFRVPVDRADGGWVVLRVCDPALPADGRAPEGELAQGGRALAYSSPFFLVAEDPAPVVPESPLVAALPLAALAVGGAALAARAVVTPAH